MDNVELIEFIESELKAALEHLSRMSEGDPADAPAHMGEARRRYDNITDALPKVALSGRRRVNFLSRLAGLRARLILAGEEL